MTRLAVVAADALLAPAAEARQTPILQICGVNGCAAVKNRRAELNVWQTWHQRTSRLAARRQPPRLAKYYRIRFANPSLDDRVVTGLYVPFGRAVRWDGSTRWLTLGRDALVAFSDAASRGRVLAYAKPPRWP